MSFFEDIAIGLGESAPVIAEAVETRREKPYTDWLTEAIMKSASGQDPGQLPEGVRVPRGQEQQLASLMSLFNTERRGRAQEGRQAARETQGPQLHDVENRAEESTLRLAALPAQLKAQLDKLKRDEEAASGPLSNNRVRARQLADRVTVSILGKADSLFNPTEREDYEARYRSTFGPIEAYFLGEEGAVDPFAAPPEPVEIPGRETEFPTFGLNEPFDPTSGLDGGVPIDAAAPVAPQLAPVDIDEDPTALERREAMAAVTETMVQRYEEFPDERDALLEALKRKSIDSTVTREMRRAAAEALRIIRESGR